MSTDSRTFHYQRALGPFFANGGFTNWTLHLGADEIVGVSLGIWPSVKAGLLAGIGRRPELAYARQEGAPQSALVDEGNPRWRRYRVATLESIAVRRCAGANEVRICARGEKAHVYAIGDRPYTEECRAVLGKLYPDLYREDGF